MRIMVSQKSQLFVKLEKSAPLLRERLEDAKSQMREIEISQGT